MPVRVEEVGVLPRAAGIPVFLMALGAFTSAAPKPEPAKDRPNIIICMTDDQGWGIPRTTRTRWV